MSYDLVTFDLDGTLVDTASEIAEATNRALASHGIARRQEAEIALLIGAGAHSLMLKLLARCFKEQPALAQRVQPEAVLQSLDEHFAQVTGSMAQPYAGCHDALTQLKAAGVALACVTNKEEKLARHVLQVTQLDHYFELLVGGDSLPEKKPHASVLRHVAHVLGTSLGRTAHLGDSATDVLAARNAGVTAWAVPYGYNAGRPIQSSAPDMLFQDLPSVSRHVLQLRQFGASARPAT